MEKKPTVAQWSTQLNKVENQLIAHYHATYPTMQVTKDSSPAELTCSLMPHSDIGGGNITIEGAGEWSRWDTGNYPKGVTASTLEAAMARYYAPLGFHVTVIKGVSYPAQISGPGNAIVDFNDEGANGWAIHVEAGCRMYTHSHSNAPATKD